MSLLYQLIFACWPVISPFFAVRYHNNFVPQCHKAATRPCSLLSRPANSCLCGSLSVAHMLLTLDCGHLCATSAAAAYACNPTKLQLPPVPDPHYSPALVPELQQVPVILRESAVATSLRAGQCRGFCCDTLSATWPPERFWHLHRSVKRGFILVVSFSKGLSYLPVFQLWLATV